MNPDRKTKLMVKKRMKKREKKKYTANSWRDWLEEKTRLLLIE